MNFQKLYYAVVVSESGSFREAARRLYMAQSSLSTAIKELEEEYQVQLFERTKKGIFITEEGSEFLTYARDILSQVEVLEKRYLEESGAKIFSVSGQHYDFAAHAFSKLVGERNEPGWDYRFLETSTNEVLQDVKTAYSEIGIIYINKNNEKVIDQYLKRYELNFYSLGEFKPHVFVGKHHPLANQDEIHLEELESYPVIRFEQKQGSLIHFSEEAVNQDRTGTTTYYATDRATVINLLAETEAYLIGSGIVASPFAKFERTIPVVSDEVNHIGYIQARYRKTSPIAERYIQIVKELIEQTRN